MKEQTFNCPDCGAPQDSASLVCQECNSESNVSFFSPRKELVPIEQPLPNEQEIVRAKDRFLDHMVFLSNQGTVRVNREQLHSGNEHLEGALLDVLVGFVEDREQGGER